jgi:3-deoxy-manno-octulosonate cytidylyltransferase (CMP-KDO synthetase)
VINVQGDEPFIDAEPLAKVIEVFRMIWIKSRASLMREITNEEDINNNNGGCGSKWIALYFSRSVIPYQEKKMWAFGTCNTSGFMRLENKHY